VTCDEARLQIGAEPGASSPALEEHLQSCSGCRQFRDEMRALDANIRRAMELAPESEQVRTVPAPPPVWRQRRAVRSWALAASVLFATLAVLAVWLLRPSDSLARAVVAHVEAEPDSWLAEQNVTREGIEAALHSAGVQLDLTSDKVTYAQSCFFRGHYVPHLVVQTSNGPATILLLRHEPITGRRTFHEDGMSGVLVPSGEGSIAVLSRGGGGGVEQVAQVMQQDVHWLPFGQ
jgi:hypothetical protein